MGEFAVRALAHAKVNLHLGVGDAREDGYHELVSVFQALDIHDVLDLETRGSVRPGEPVVLGMDVSGAYAQGVPANEQNLAWRAVEMVARGFRDRGVGELPGIHISLRKGIPAAGGMAGGSADAAAALRAANEAFARAAGYAGLDESALYAAAEELGSDVPFTLLGGTALGTGRGERLAEMLTRSSYHWALITSAQGLSTPAVFGELDRLRAAGQGGQPHLDAQPVSQALLRGTPEALAEALANDLQPAALSLRPDLRQTLRVGKSAGGLAGIVSGSGPTCAFLCADPEAAADVVGEVTAEIPGTRGLVAQGPAKGAHLVEAPGSKD
ncbi:MULTISPECIES: 4-(cytidine 5'-diphospho)-2-C-methyl-D-erythritol kinase [unclassified Corynebacterium]|uniref:4-(cytidine 5'-diphospho)-2-C-methyl-D-erythritol kinase n=1 Tax=unclassified Corynebacterium TaxID=2624378 RepID=UPI0034CEB16E